MKIKEEPEQFIKTAYEQYANSLDRKAVKYEDLEVEDKLAWQRLFIYCYDVGFHDFGEKVKVKNEGKIFPFFDKDSSLIVIAALRYCQGRMTYMPATVTEWVKLNWDSIRPEDRKVIARDVSQYISSGASLGDICDEVTWKTFHKWLLEQPGIKVVEDN